MIGSWVFQSGTAVQILGIDNDYPEFGPTLSSLLQVNDISWMLL